MKRNLICLCLALFVLLSPALDGIALASAEPQYIVTEQELLQLEDNLKALESQRQWLLNELKELAKQNQQLEKDLTELKVLSLQQENQLKIANESLQKYAKEEKSKRLKIKRQRNLAYALLVGSTVFMLGKEIKK